MRVFSYLVASTIFVNTSGCFSAISASTLRSRSTFFIFKLLISFEYVVPFNRAAALIFTFHNRRKTRFFARRSRKALAPALSIAGRASLILLFRPHRYPFTLESKLFRLFVCCVPRLTLGIYYL
jgi:hypothetical protein